MVVGGMRYSISRRMAFGVAAVAILIAGCAGAVKTQSASANQGQLGPGVPAFQVRPGYRVDIAADNIQTARFLEFDDKGTLYVSLPRQGEILSLKDTNGDGVYDKRETFISGKPTVHGMHFKDGWLWFTQTQAIHKARDTSGDGKADEVVTVIPESELPGGGGHWWRPILVTDSHIYTGVGDSGNIKDETDTERQKIWRFNLDGTGKSLFATGIRNTEKLRLRPGTNEIWGCDHGSDWFGAPLGEREKGKQPVTDLQPPCEFNHYVEGGFYGHPFIVGDKLPRIEYHDRPDILDLAEKTIPPAWNLGAHWAPNGFCFATADTLGPDHKGDAFIAFHGSWNSTVKVGYRIERILFDEVTSKPYGSLSIITTITDNQEVLARPVDCVEAPDGTLLWSCDYSHRVYRISKAN